MSDKSEPTSDTLVKLPIPAKKALRVYAAKKSTTMELVGAEFIVDGLQKAGELPKTPATKK